MDQSSFMAIFGLVYIAGIVALAIIPSWLIISKAGKPGWTSLIPLYNTYLLVKISGKPGWWLILLCIPIINIIFLILTFAGLAKNFGKSSGFAVGLILLSPIFYPILGYGKSEYCGEQI